MEDLNDWKAYRNGDKAAFERIFRQYIRLLYKYGSRFTTDAGMVEDSIQELFIDLWEKRESIGETDSIKRYLLGALRRRIVRKQQKQLPLNHDDSEDNYSFDLETNVEALLIGEETMAQNKLELEKAIASLSKRQKEIIYLKYYQELSFSEIEETLGISYQSARNLLHKALQAIKEVFPSIKQIILLIAINLFI